MQTVHPKEVGVDADRVEHLFHVIEKKITQGWLFGGAFLLARRGKIVITRWHVLSDLVQACGVD